jgi:general L-amino acid transport system substrate-binding protein
MKDGGHWRARVAVALAAGMLTCVSAWAGPTVDLVRGRGTLVCGTHLGLPGFGALNSQGRWEGMDVDLCRAVAAAVLGDPEKVRFVPLSAQQRFAALQSGEIDLLARSATWTFSRESELGVSFAAITFHDVQAIMVAARTGVKSAAELHGATVCVQAGTTNEKNLSDYSRSHGLQLRPIVFDTLEAAVAAYLAGRCAAYTNDTASLAAVRGHQVKAPADHVILPDRIAKEPLAVAVRKGDETWLSIVRWTVYGLVNAEELGITRANVDAMRASERPDVLRALGGEDLGKGLGLDAQWLYRAVKAVGNYGEIFQRNLGEGTPVGLVRGPNALWRDGGLLYAPPLR